jgi:hypothetical protein
LAPGGGRPAWWSSLHQLSPLTQASPPRVDVWQPRLGPNRLKPWPVGQGVGPVGRPLGLLGLGSGALGPCVKYTPVVMMILHLVNFTLPSLEMIQFGTQSPEIK